MKKGSKWKRDEGSQKEEWGEQARRWEESQARRYEGKYGETSGDEKEKRRMVEIGEGKNTNKLKQFK